MDLFCALLGMLLPMYLMVLCLAYFCRVVQHGGYAFVAICHCKPLDTLVAYTTNTAGYTTEHVLVRCWRFVLHLMLGTCMLCNVLVVCTWIEHIPALMDLEMC